MFKHNARWLVVIAAIWLAATRQVYAEGSEIQVQMQVKPPDKNNAKTKDDAPQVEVTVIGAQNAPTEKFTLRDEGAKQPVELKPTSRREYTQGTDTLAVAIVLCSWKIFIGTDDIFTDEKDPARYTGVLKNLETAFDKLNFKDAGPPGSLGALITYADSAVTRIPMGPLEKMSGSALGSQQDYKDMNGVEMVKGIELALAELHKVPAVRKVLIVIGDGRDANPAASKGPTGSLATLKKQATQDHVQTFAIIYRTEASSVGDDNGAPVIGLMVPSPKIVNSIDNIATTVQSILASMADRVYLTFPGFDPKVGLGLPWDGKQHNLILKVDKDDAEPYQLTMAPPWNVAKGGFPWLAVILSLIGAIVLVAIGVKVFSAKPAPPPMPVVMPVAVAEAPKPMGPAKTVMIGVGGDEGGFPVVGWLVPLNGVQAYQTFRLRSGGTKIGTAPPCDIVVNDGFMSTEHCQINASPQGFMLVDGGSTNGCYVNERKIQGKQDLVDNDMVTLGKTNFKFKSIN